jgi:hypothetical protein
MATRDEPLDPQEVLEAAEAAHLAARRTVPISRTRPRQPERDTVRPDQQTVRLDQETVRLPAGRPTGGVRGKAPLALAAAVAAGWAALVSLVPVAVFVMLLQAAATGPFAVVGSVRIAAAGWLLAHGVPNDTPVGPITIAPLALSALAAWRVARAGVHVTRAMAARGRGSPAQALVAAGAVAAGYGAIGTLVALAAGGSGWGVSVPRAALTVTGFGFAAAWYGSLRATGVLPAWTGRLPPALWHGIRTGLVAATVVLAAGGMAAGVALAAGGGPAADIIAAYRTNVAGQAGLTLLCLAYAPNLAGWAAAYLVGPGFAVGTDTVVRSSEVTVGPLPALPVFAGLPDGPLPTTGAVLLAVPIVAGAVAGALLARGGSGYPPLSAALAWARLALGVAVSGVTAGALLGLAAAGSGGSLGGGQLATFGPDPVLVAGVSAVTVAAGGMLGAAATAVLARRREL